MSGKQNIWAFENDFIKGRGNLNDKSFLIFLGIKARTSYADNVIEFLKQRKVFCKNPPPPVKINKKAILAILRYASIYKSILSYIKIRKDGVLFLNFNENAPLVVHALATYMWIVKRTEKDLSKIRNLSEVLETCENISDRIKIKPVKDRIIPDNPKARKLLSILKNWGTATINELINFLNVSYDELMCELEELKRMGAIKIVDDLVEWHGGNCFYPLYLGDLFKYRCFAKILDMLAGGVDEKLYYAIKRLLIFVLTRCMSFERAYKNLKAVFFDLTEEEVRESKPISNIFRFIGSHFFGIKSKRGCRGMCGKKCWFFEICGGFSIE